MVVSIIHILRGDYKIAAIWKGRAEKGHPTQFSDYATRWMYEESGLDLMQGQMFSLLHSLDGFWVQATCYQIGYMGGKATEAWSW